MHAAVNTKIPSKLPETDTTVYMMQKGFTSFFNKCSCYRDIWNSSLSLAASYDLLFLRNSPQNIIGIGYNFLLPKNCPFPLRELLKWKGLSATDLGILVGSYFAASKTVAVWRETTSLRVCSPAFAVTLGQLGDDGHWCDLISSSGQCPPLQWHGEGTVFILQLAEGSGAQVWYSLGSVFTLKVYQSKQ